MQYQKYNYISFFKKYFGANYILTKLIVVTTEPAVQRQRSPLKYHEVLVRNTANGYTCLEKLTTEKCKQQAKQPEKKILKIKIS